jgi:hypothetical protein
VVYSAPVDTEFMSSANVSYTPAGTGAVATTVQSKLRESVSVKDFGAVGDGVADDTAAIQAALAASTQVVFPAGTYLVSTVTITGGVLAFVSGAVLSIPTGQTVSFVNTQIDAGRQKIFNCGGTGKVNGTVNNDLIFPEWWGAIADGLHPPTGVDFSDRAAAAARNAPALQAALTFAGNQYSFNGLAGTVSLTYGYYVYNTTLSIPLSVNLIGYGIGSALFYYAATGNAVEMISTNNSLVSDIFIAPIAGPTWNYTTGHGLHMDGVSTPIVRNVWCSSFGSGDFYIKSCIEGRFYGLISDNANGGSFDISGVGQGSVFQNCVTAGTDGGPGFNIHDGYDWTLIGCTSKDASTGTYGFYLNAVENINLIGCIGYSNVRDAFYLTASVLNCNLTNCTANDPSTGSSGTYYGFNVSGTKNKLVGCKVTANTPMYGYALVFGGGATDCSTDSHNFVSGTSGIILDAQPTGINVYQIAKATTTNATPINLFTKFLNNNTGVTLEALVTMKQRGATGATASYKVWCMARTNSTDTVILAGPTTIWSYESNAATNATWVVTSAAANGTVALQITGLVGTAIDWEAVITVVGVTG